MTDLMAEVESDINEEKFYNFVKKYLKIAMIFSMLVVIFVVIYSYRQNNKIQMQELVGNKYYEAALALEEENYAEAKKIFQEVESIKNPNYSAFAALKLAEISLKEKNIDIAKTHYQSIIDNKKYDIIVRNIAQINLISYNDDRSLEEDISILKILSEDDKPWRFSALFLLGNKLIKARKSDEAKKIFSDLANNENAPQMISNNARMVMIINNWK